MYKETEWKIRSSSSLKKKKNYRKIECIYKCGNSQKGRFAYLLLLRNFPHSSGPSSNLDNEY